MQLDRNTLRRLALIVGAILILAASVMASTIGTFTPQQQIQVISQDYIDSYFNWDIRQVDKTTWLATFTIDKTFWDSAKTCAASLTKQACYTTLCASTSLTDNCNSTSVAKVQADLTNMSSYPLASTSRDMGFSNMVIDAAGGKGTFTISFPNGFKEGLSAKLGFGSTTINTTLSSNLWMESSRQICRDSNNEIHAVWANKTVIGYANSTNNGLNWNTSTNFYTCGNPSISCDGVNVAITCGVSSNLYLGLSTNDGGTFTWQTVKTDDNYGYQTVEMRGQYIYLFYSRLFQGTFCTASSAGFTKSTNLGSTWSASANLASGACHQKNPNTYTKWEYPSASVVGGGAATDNVLVSFYDADFDGITYTNAIAAWNSSSAGATWSSEADLTYTAQAPMQE